MPGSGRVFYGPSRVIWSRGLESISSGTDCRYRTLPEQRWPAAQFDDDVTGVTRGRERCRVLRVPLPSLIHVSGPVSLHSRMTASPSRVDDRVLSAGMRSARSPRPRRSHSRRSRRACWHCWGCPRSGRCQQESGCHCDRLDGAPGWRLRDKRIGVVTEQPLRDCPARAPTDCPR